MISAEEMRRLLERVQKAEDEDCDTDKRIETLEDALDAALQRWPEVRTTADPEAVFRELLDGEGQ